MPNHRPLPPLARLNELLEVVEIPPDKYGTWSGLVWKVRRGCRRAGSVAGNPQPTLRNSNRVDWVVGVDGVKYLASRLIYCMARGEDPGDVQVDHEDQNWLNNNAWNLRLDVDGGVQPVNRSTQRNNTSGVVGVGWHKTARKWTAQVGIENKLKYLGLFTCKIDAARAVNEEWHKLGWLELGRKPNDLSRVSCDCSKCSTRDNGPTRFWPFDHPPGA